MAKQANREARLGVVAFIPLLVLSTVFAVYLNSSLPSVNDGTASVTPGRSVENLTQFVDPFVGTSASAPYGAGDTFPGAAYPMGMVQWSPDTPSNPPGGYNYQDSMIKGFSLTHFSGRGCTVYQDFPFIPFVGNLSVSPASDPSAYYGDFSHTNETAHPGYYEVYLENWRVTVALSITSHTGVGQFIYPPSNFSTMLINTAGSVNGVVNSSVEISPASNEISGFAESTVGCGMQHYTIYFAAEFDRPFYSFGTWDGASVSPNSTSSSGTAGGAFVTFDTSSNAAVRVEVGISFVSIGNALTNIELENSDYNVSAAAESTATAWNNILNRIQVGGGTESETASFYTALYHCFLDPNIFSDANGQYIGFDGKIHTVPEGYVQYDNIAGWDQYRSQIRLLAIIDPSVASDIAQSLVNDAEQGDGHLPRWEQANVDSHGMSGDSADVLITEAYVFGATNFNASAALNAMINGQPEIREGLSDYMRLGYVPADSGTTPYSASVTLEYSNDDFAIAQLATTLGKNADYATFLARSANWENVFNNATGYAQPRDQNGAWAPDFSPTSQFGFHEGDSAQYTWLVTFNLAELFARMGGNQAVVARLDNFFTQLNDGPSSPYAFMGNEPTFEVPWEYDFAGSPSHTQDVVRRMVLQLFNDTPGGLPGNDDGGAMSSWYVFAVLGIYPEITAVGGFVVGSPLFNSACVSLSGGHFLNITSANAGDGNPYVTALSINGVSTQSLWIPWSEISNGVVLNFSLTNSPTSWGTSAADSPPSFP